MITSLLYGATAFFAMILGPFIAMPKIMKYLLTSMGWVADIAIGLGMASLIAAGTATGGFAAMIAGGMTTFFLIGASAFKRSFTPKWWWK